LFVNTCSEFHLNLFCKGFESDAFIEYDLRIYYMMSKSKAQGKRRSRSTSGVAEVDKQRQKITIPKTLAQFHSCSFWFCLE